MVREDFVTRGKVDKRVKQGKGYKQCEPPKRAKERGKEEEWKSRSEHGADIGRLDRLLDLFLVIRAAGRVALLESVDLDARHGVELARDVGVVDERRVERDGALGDEGRGDDDGSEDGEVDTSNVGEDGLKKEESRVSSCSPGWVDRGEGD